MSHTPSLPLEILEHILHDLSLDKPAQLKRCSLVCWTFVPICRKYLFATIRLYICGTRPTRKSEQVLALLRKYPEIPGHARHLGLHFELDRGLATACTVPPEFEMFSRLESYELSFLPFTGSAGSSDSSFHIDFYDEEPPRSWEPLFRPMPTLKTLKLERIENFPFYNLLNYPNIHELVLSHIQFSDPENVPIPTAEFPCKTIKLDSLSLDSCTVCWDDDVLDVPAILDSELWRLNGHPIMDISDLKHFKLTMCNDYTGEWTLILEPVLLRTNQLITFTLESGGTVSVLYELTGIGQSLLGSIKTLKEICITTDADDFFTDDPLHGLCEELVFLGSHPNVLESLWYHLSLGSRSECSTGNEWRALDRVIDTFNWPMLKKITIIIDIEEDEDEYDPEDDELDRPRYRFKCGLESLRARQFPTLCGRKDIDFKFEVRWIPLDEIV